MTPVHGSGYASDASESLNQITAPDSYAALSTIEGTPIRYVVLTVVNQAIYWQLQKSSGGPNGIWESQETYQLPGTRVITRSGITGIRIRAAVLAAQIPSGAHQAIVSVEAVK